MVRVNKLRIYALKSDDLDIVMLRSLVWCAWSFPRVCAPPLYWCGPWSPSPRFPWSRPIFWPGRLRRSLGPSCVAHSCWSRERWARKTMRAVPRGPARSAAAPGPACAPQCSSGRCSPRLSYDRRDKDGRSRTPVCPGGGRAPGPSWDRARRCPPFCRRGLQPRMRSTLRIEWMFIEYSWDICKCMD